jgi:elongation factor Ts
MAIDPKQVKQLRESTGAGMMDCKKALTKAEGDFDKAVEFLREQGLGKAAKKADRLAAEGAVYVEKNGNKVTILEMNSETDFVAKNDEFKKVLDATIKLIQENDIKTLEELNATSIDGTTYEEYLKGKIATIGENIVVRRFETFQANENETINGYVHANGRIATILKANTNSSDVANKITDTVRNVCMHAAAMKPKFLKYTELDKEFVEKETLAKKAEIEKENIELVRLGKKEKNIPSFVSMIQLTNEILKQTEESLKEELKAQGKPEKIWDKIIPGQLDRFISDNTLLDQELVLLSQAYVMDDKKTVEQALNEEAKKAGGDAELTAYVRYELGEGLEKKGCDFAAEVAAQLN